MVRRGFTLIEMLAVIAILLVVMAISLPAIEGRLGGAKFDAAVRRVDAGMAWARAEAQRRGEALRVQVRGVREGTGLFLERLEKAEPSGRGGSNESQREPQPFAVLEAGISMSDRAPNAEGSEKGVDAPAAEDGKTTKAGQPGSEAVDVGLTIGMFLPDGSAMAAGTVYIVGFERAASLTVNHWTGGVQVAELNLSGKGEVGWTGGTGATGGGSAREGEQ